MTRLLTKSYKGGQMNKTIEDLEAYLQRKKSLRDSHSRSVDSFMEDDTEENYDRAKFHLRKANELQNIIWAIEHCIKLVKANV